MIITSEMLSVTIKITTVRNRSCIHREPSLVLCDDLEGCDGESPLEGGSGGKGHVYIYIHIHIYTYI